ncbi:phage baseplate assembly protein V [Ornithinimicrobium pekingense]|uniref:Gp5/Type VI secretion system Vgr protein OB-fold domain-containing protein n=1 Tax=Ornithinimicrobium pekingense TaxID=384677 RepID=A0ABQ2F5B2_9MICO|nr:phage baseplate assembly protein V [Ornithinimicrobium pekingense]GGK63449.1 hypothetical protein GCM10011509_09810 [Ornithinimicrobium pekingense]
MGLLDLLGDDDRATDSRRLGVVRGEVTENTDLTMQGRVRVKFPTIPGIEPWASVCAPFAGDGYGLWCMPQVGDVVVVAFENGDLNWPLVVGSVWDSSNRPPVDLPTDAVTKRVLRTPMGHELVLDDLEATVTITHVAGHTITMSVDEVSIELKGGVGSVTLSLPGRAEVSAKVSADVKAGRTSVKGDATLDLSGTTTSLTGDTTCKVTGGLVTIN